jgi:hypothetical protein
MQLAAMLRAAHLLWDDPPKILEDTLVLRLCGFENAAALRLAYEAAIKHFAERVRLDSARSAAPLWPLSRGCDRPVSRG